jgi:hypothetical protein
VVEVAEQELQEREHLVHQLQVEQDLQIVISGCSSLLMQEEVKSMEHQERQTQVVEVEQVAGIS